MGVFWTGYSKDKNLDSYNVAANIWIKNSANFCVNGPVQRMRYLSNIPYRTLPHKKNTTHQDSLNALLKITSVYQGAFCVHQLRLIV